MHKLQDLCEHGTKVNVAILYNGGTQSEMHYWLNRKSHSLRCSFRAQTAGNLGEKLTSAVKESFRKGNTEVVVIGQFIFMSVFTYLTYLLFQNTEE